MKPFRDTLTNLDEMIERRYISVREHPAAPLFIYNYTAKTQYDRMWNDTTQQCRGLILDANGNLVQRPFRKFFNLGERGMNIPPEQPEVWHKYDGSLGVLYWVDGRPAIASRGSFLSDQALRATRILEERYPDAERWLLPECTYLFEIIYPENRIVVDYGDTEELRLLAVIDTASGKEYPPSPGYGFPIAERALDAEGTEPWQLPFNPKPNAEGYVLHWREHGLRLKVKFSDYLRIHKIVTGLTMKGVWEALRDGQSDVIEVARAGATEQFREWIDGVVGNLSADFSVIESACLAAMRLVPDSSRKEQAEYIKTEKYPAVMFKMLDGHPYEPLIWQMVKPGRGFETFRKDGE